MNGNGNGNGDDDEFLLYKSQIAGDCRAVLGRENKTEGGRIEAIQLTHDHNVREATELKKLKAAHPRTCV